MSLTITQVDAFTSEPFSGNPAAVCLLPAPVDAAWMQRVAREMNLSETAFLVRREVRRVRPALVHARRGGRPLRPRHAGKRSRALGRRAPAAGCEPAVFHTRSGQLVGGASRQAGSRWTSRRNPPNPRPRSGRSGYAALGARPTCPWAGTASTTSLKSTRQETVERLTPDYSTSRARSTHAGSSSPRCAESPRESISCRASSRHGTGVDEDPVTGSAHCCLGPYWQSPARPGYLHRTAGFRSVAASSRSPSATTRVLLSGQAVTVLRGELLA